MENCTARSGNKSLRLVTTFGLGQLLLTTTFVLTGIIGVFQLPKVEAHQAEGKTSHEERLEKSFKENLTAIHIRIENHTPTRLDDFLWHAYRFNSDVVKWVDAPKTLEAHKNNEFFYSAKKSNQDIGGYLKYQAGDQQILILYDIFSTENSVNIVICPGKLCCTGERCALYLEWLRSESESIYVELERHSFFKKNDYIEKSLTRGNLYVTARLRTGRQAKLKVVIRQIQLKSDL